MNPLHKRALIPRLVILLAVCAVLIYLLLIALVCWREAHVAPASHQQDAIIVLGAQVRPDGSPSNQLRWRVDAAAEAYRIHPSPVVVCGAQGKDEPDTEAAVMKQILLTSGVPEDDILLDSTSFNTRQNLAHAYELLKDLKEAGYDMYLLTNASLRHHVYWPKCDAAEFFPEDHIFLSADWKLLKPSLEYFETAVKHFGLNREECLFIDDAPANAEAAIFCGIDAIVFNGSHEELREKLRTRGIQI